MSENSTLNLSTTSHTSAANSLTSAPHSKNAALRDGQAGKLDQEKSRNLIEQAVSNLIDQLEQGHSETLTAYLRAMARFHTYSFGNVLEIARQRPTATRVAGFGKWKELGRFVKRGEKGIRILAPMTFRRVRKPEFQAEVDDTHGPILFGFRPVYVFDIEQTEGADLPEFGRMIRGEVGGNRDLLIAFLAEQNIALEFNEQIAPSLGVSYGGRIAILPGLSKAEEFTTLVHEIAHLCCVKNYVVVRCSVLS